MTEETDRLRAFTQDDLMALTMRTSLGLLGPVGVVVGDFLTQFLPRQRVDRLHDWVAQLSDRMADVEEQFRERLSNSPAYATLAENAAVAAVQTPSDNRRKELATLLRMGISEDDAELAHRHALLDLLVRVNDPQMLILMFYGSFSDSLHDPAREAFMASHAAVFVDAPTYGSTGEHVRRWTMHEHYVNELVQMGLLRDSEGIAKSGSVRRVALTRLGGLLLAAIGYAGKAAETAM